MKLAFGMKPVPKSSITPGFPTTEPRLRAALDALAARKNKLAEQTDALHRAIDGYVFLWRDVRIAAGLSVEGVFPPSDDPAEAMVPRDRRKVPV